MARGEGDHLGRIAWRVGIGLADEAVLQRGHKGERGLSAKLLVSLLVWTIGPFNFMHDALWGKRKTKGYCVLGHFLILSC